MDAPRQTCGPRRRTGIGSSMIIATGAASSKALVLEAFAALFATAFDGALPRPTLDW
jgi:hypothetical protein